MQIQIQLDDEQAAKLVQLQQHTQQDQETVIKQALNVYYQQLQPSSTNAIDLFEQVGFVGCGSADPTLSANAKSALRSSMRERFERSRES
jgi:hypothetical protein